MTLPELVIATLILVAVLVPLGSFFLDSSAAFSSLARRSYMAARAPVIMDRLVDELMNGRFTSLAPAVPLESDWVRFDRIVDFVAGAPVNGNPIQIDLVPLESVMGDLVDNDGDGLIDEGGIRIWEDIPPEGTSPGVEDSPVIIATNVAGGGFKLTRKGSLLLLDVTFQEVVERGRDPITLNIKSGVMMRNE